MIYIDGDTINQCREAIRQGRTLADLANRLHIDTEYLGRLLQQPCDRTGHDVMREQPRPDGVSTR